MPWRYLESSSAMVSSVAQSGFEYFDNDPIADDLATADQWGLSAWLHARCHENRGSIGFKLCFLLAVAMSVDLSVQIGSLTLPNPILVASGTFGYAREMEEIVDLSRLGGILPKTITSAARAGNKPWRTVETTGGLLNSIGLDNDGIDYFIDYHLPYLSATGSPLIVSIAGRSDDDFVEMAKRLGTCSGIAAIELNISCPNVSGGIDFGTDALTCEHLVARVKLACPHPVIVKLTPNVTRIADIAAAAESGGADAISAINTLQGMAIDWRKQKPLLGNVIGGLSGPAIKPVALRCVFQIAAAVKIPIIGIGGISTLDDVMQFLVAGASAVQVGTANYFRPTLCNELIDALPSAIESLGAKTVGEMVGSLKLPA